MSDLLTYCDRCKPDGAVKRRDVDDARLTCAGCGRAHYGVVWAAAERALDRLTADDVRRIREDASEHLERHAASPPTTPGAKHVRTLTDQRDSKIVRLCDELLDVLDVSVSPSVDTP